MIWVLFVAMTMAAAVATGWPLAVGRAKAARTGGEAEFYRAQLAEIERDVERGVLPQGEAAAARAEAGRRLISVVEGVDAVAADSAGTARRLASTAVIVALLAGAGVGLYGTLGSPRTPDAPLASRKPEQDNQVAQAIAHVEAETVAQPDKIDAWSALAPVYVRLGRYPDAVRAFGEVLRLGGESGDIRAQLGEAEVAAAAGKVTPPAREDFEKALAAQPDSVIARYYLALADEQAGDKAKAAAVYETLVGAAAGHPQWQDIIKSRLASLKGEPPPPAPGASDQQEMIRGMVGGLADRLAHKGGTAEEWKQLVRSYSVLGDAAKARDALASARNALAGDAAAVDSVDALAGELGLKNMKEAQP